MLNMNVQMHAQYDATATALVRGRGDRLPIRQRIRSTMRHRLVVVARARACWRSVTCKLEIFLLYLSISTVKHTTTQTVHASAFNFGRVWR